MLADGLTKGAVDREALVLVCERGLWRGDPQRKEKSNPDARLDFPNYGAQRAHVATNDEAAATVHEVPHQAEMTTALVNHQQGGPSARPAWATTPAEVTAAQFYVNLTSACLATSLGSALAFISVEDLLRESGGELTFDAACSKCVGGLDWYNALQQKLATFGIEPIECPEKEPYRFGASKVVRSITAVLIPRAVRGKAFTVWMSIARGAAPGLFIRQAQSELEPVYRAPTA